MRSSFFSTFVFYSFMLILFCQTINSMGWAEKTLATLSLDEKIGQLFFVAVRSNSETDYDPLFRRISNTFNLYGKYDVEYARRMIDQYHVGGILYICIGDPITQHQITNQLQKQSRLPLLFAQDFEWGLAMRLKNTICFPKNIVLGAIEKEGIVYRMAREIARQCRIIGVHINLSPVMDINNNPDNPIIGDRSFGSDREIVTKKGIEMIRGLEDGGILACAKHFPGHGDVCMDSHLSLPIINHDIDRLKKIELYPFKMAIDSGVSAIMTAHLQIPALEPLKIPVSLSTRVVTNLLKEELGFNGLIISDGLVMKGVTNSCVGDGDVELKSLLASHDILLYPKDVGLAFKKIKEAISGGILSQEDIDKHVLKILRTKEKLKLHENRLTQKSINLDELNTKEALELQKELFEYKKS